jgi:putative tryptophan/tyrosine transport system substrate-binding protein
MKRRDFIRLLGGAAAVASPLAARAQQAERMRRVGVLISSTEDDPQVRRQTAAFQQGLLELGWMEGRNVRIDFRFLGDDPSRIKTYAAELVALKPDALLASGPTAVVALQQEASTIPIIFAQVNDPVGAGLVETLARPGGNVTGFTPSEFSIGGKMLEVLRDLASDVKRVGVILDAKLSDQIGMWTAMEAVAPSLGLRLQQLSVPDDPADIANPIGSFAGNQNGGLIVLANRNTILHRKRIIAAASKHHLPAVYSYRYFVQDGGLVSYGADLLELYKRAASYVDRILKGERPADLPVQQPTKYELVLNLKTAKALGLAVPPTLLATADEVIE